MNSINSLLLLILAISLFSCGDGSGKKTSDFSLNLGSEKAEFRLGDTLRGELISRKNAAIDSVVYSLHGKRIMKTIDHPLLYLLEDEKLGRWDLSAVVYSEGTQEEVREQVTIFNDTPPVSYSYKVIASYPHSPDAYTQGLEFYNDTLYESTGQYGESTLRKVDLRTGEILDMVKLDDSRFAEGITILNGRIYQLTWKEGEGLIYDVNTLEQTGKFPYNQSKEGWGLANDGERLYKSDGTEKIWILDPETLEEVTYIQTLTHRTISTQLNELEWVEGTIYANTYQRDGVAMINPENGAIEGLINFKGLRDQLSNQDDLDPVNDVLNGIAYNPRTGNLYVTGKDWDTLFEVEIVEK